MSDENEENPETGAGNGGSISATGPGTENAVGHDTPTTPQMGDASDGGDFLSPSPPENENEGSEGNTGKASAPSERGSADSENNVSEQALTERARLTAENIRIQELSNAPRGASMLQDDVGGQRNLSKDEYQKHERRTKCEHCGVQWIL